MQIKILLGLITLFLFSLPACQDPLDEGDLIYIGSWSSQKYYLEIGANGYGFCQRRNRDPLEGWVRITNKRMVFHGDDGGRQSFCIDNPPAIDIESGAVFMVLDNRTFWLH